MIVVEPDPPAPPNISAEAVLAAWRELKASSAPPAEPPPEPIEIDCGDPECAAATSLKRRLEKIDAEHEAARRAWGDREPVNVGAYGAPAIGLGELQLEPARPQIEYLTPAAIEALMKAPTHLGHGGGGSKGRARKKRGGSSGEVSTNAGIGALLAFSRFTARGLSRGVHEFYAQRPNEYAVDVLADFVRNLTGPPELTCAIAADAGARSLEIYGLSATAIATLKLARGIARVVLIEHAIAKEPAFIRRRDGRLPTISPLTTLPRAC